MHICWNQYPDVLPGPLSIHFHVEYGDESAVIGIDPIIIIEGHLSSRIRNKVFAWAAIHQPELRANWELARGRKPLLRIAPLD